MSLPHARPGGSTGTSRASLRQKNGAGCAMRGSPPVDYRDELHPSSMSPNTCQPSPRPLHLKGGEGARRASLKEMWPI